MLTTEVLKINYYHCLVSMSISYVSTPVTVVSPESSVQKVVNPERKFSPQNAPETFGGRAPPGPAGGAHSAPPDPLAGYPLPHPPSRRLRRLDPRAFGVRMAPSAPYPPPEFFFWLRPCIKLMYATIDALGRKSTMSSDIAKANPRPPVGCLSRLWAVMTVLSQW